MSNEAISLNRDLSAAERARLIVRNLKLQAAKAAKEQK